jgi:hypothetical protein
LGKRGRRYLQQTQENLTTYSVDKKTFDICWMFFVYLLREMVKGFELRTLHLPGKYSMA